MCQMCYIVSIYNRSVVLSFRVKMDVQAIEPISDRIAITTLVGW
ncbi:hypothetical protein HanRHA438_Chr14g0658091 [Helianthus annuus]|nr:hypothetical protein HanIR_Chr14g0702231 [Helianthus annuus]KAJ0854037.1 hypothetical protein HanRHA438_Chr14g0658091 [Helianthus annuus]